ncbi:MAG: glycosyltransferase family 2 protein, partial [Aquabacterium sp.]|uniref:glycosyltransferase family 2 protein n=1 Tax=Aquabacterium sp. TaxID=1872578 RepID=UPI001228344C
VIVADDASTDTSWDVILDWLQRDSRLRALRNKRNGGKSVAMNRAIAIARGRWLAVLDADDWFHPERLRALVAVGERRQVDLVADNQLFYDTIANTVVGSAWPAGPTDWDLTFDDFLFGSNAYETFNLGMLKPILRAEFTRASGLSYDEKARHGQDFLYLLQFYLLGGKAAVSDGPYYFYTQPFGALSHQWSHAARRRYDFQTAYEINKSYVEMASGSVTPTQLRRLKARNHQLQILEHYYSAKDLFDRGEKLASVLNVIRHPLMVGYAARRLLKRYAGVESLQAAAYVAGRSRRRSQENPVCVPGVVQ